MKSGHNSDSSLSSSSSLSAPTTPFVAPTSPHHYHSGQPTTSKTSRRQVVSAPATLKATDIPSYSSNSGLPVHGRNLSLNSSSSSTSSRDDEILMLNNNNTANNAAAAAAKKRKTHKSPSSTAASSPANNNTNRHRRTFDLSFRNVYTTKDCGGRARVGSGSGAPAGCAVM